MHRFIKLFHLPIFEELREVHAKKFMFLVKIGREIIFRSWQLYDLFYTQCYNFAIVHCFVLPRKIVWVRDISFSTSQCHWLAASTQYSICCPPLPCLDENASIKMPKLSLLLLFQFDNMRGHVVASFDGLPTSSSYAEMNFIDRHLKRATWILTRLKNCPKMRK